LKIIRLLEKLWFLPWVLMFAFVYGINIGLILWEILKVHPKGSLFN